jgi:Tol biopolymer transport system component
MPSSTRGLLGAFSLALFGACNSEKTLTTPAAATPTDSLAATFPPFVGPIAFTSTRDGSPYIYVAAGDGSPARRLAKGQYPAWSWDDRSIAFNDLTADGSGPALHVINADGSGDRVLPLNGIEPVWSPDGTRLMFRTPRGIYAANLDGTGLSRLVNNDFPNAGDVAVDPALSPDGASIAFVAGSPDDTFQIYIANADGTNPRRLFSGVSMANRSRPRWSPDGSTLAFETGGTIVTVATDGSNLRTLVI